MDYVLISDSTADLPIDVIKELNVEIIPFSYSIDDKPYNYYLDERDGNVDEFYSKLKSGAMPVTSQINPAVYKDTFKKYVKEGKGIIYLCFSSGLSGSFQSSVMIKNMVLEDYPEAKIEILDSRSASIGQGVFLYAAAKLKENGMSMDELCDWIREKTTKVSHWFMVEDLFHLSRGGRLSAVGAVVGSALKIMPILSVDDEGKLVVKAKMRGVNKAIDYLVSKAVEESENLSEMVAVIGHADAIDKAQKIKSLVIAEGMKEENIMIAPIGPIIGTHVGAGMAAIAFIPK